MLWLGSVLLLAGGLRRDRVPVVRELTAADILATAPMIIAAFNGDGAAARAARGPVGALVAAYTQAVDRSQMGAGLRQRLGQTAQFVAEVEDDDADDDARGAPGGAGSIVGARHAAARGHDGAGERCACCAREPGAKAGGEVLQNFDKKRSVYSYVAFSSPRSRH